MTRWFLVVLWCVVCCTRASLVFVVTTTGTRPHYLRATLRSLVGFDDADTTVVRVPGGAAWDTKIEPVYHVLRRENWCNLARNFGDTLGRVLWRSKLVLDRAYALEYAFRHTFGSSYMCLEDDNVIDHSAIGWVWQYPDDYRSIVHTNASSYNVISLASGIVVPRVEVPALVRFLRRHFDVAPLDWLMGAYITHRIATKQIRFVCKPAGLRHIGDVSTGSAEFDRVLWNDWCKKPIDFPTWEAGRAIKFDEEDMHGSDFKFDEEDMHKP
jgi:hypothetical protein